MRKHDVRKWLHAILDLLPVILIPVFMIYSHRHDVTERTDVEVTYKYESNEVNTLDDLVDGNIYYLDYFYIQDYCEIQVINIQNCGNNPWDFSIDDFYTTDTSLLIIQYNENGLYLLVNNSGFGIDLWTENYDPNETPMYLQDMIFIYHNSLYDIFEDRGDEPQYTDYNVIESVEINDTKSSVMNVFMDDFNNSIDKYFNMGNVFNLNGVYQWFNTNIFSGNAPTIIYSIWNIALYELVMDLLFLLYGLFMWFIDMIQKLMEKPLNSVR